MTARKNPRSAKKGASGRVTPKGTKPAAAASSAKSAASDKSKALPRPVLDQRLKQQGTNYGAHSASRSGRRGGR